MCERMIIRKNNLKFKSPEESLRRERERQKDRNSLSQQATAKKISKAYIFQTRFQHN